MPTRNDTVLASALCSFKGNRLTNFNSLWFVCSFFFSSPFYQFIQNSAIVAQIPFLRETLETLLVRVTELMVANNCASTDVWNIASLKNKDLHGHVITEVCIYSVYYILEVQVGYVFVDKFT